jgi:RimJ/RimL family protein N-acetyltransferase
MMLLETERLVVRNFRAHDWETLHEIIVQYESSAMAVYDHQWPTSPDKIEEIAAWFAQGDSFLAVCLKDTHRLIGMVSLNLEKAELPEFNLGYIFGSAYHGKGYATEACRAVLGYAFTQLQAQRVVTGTAAANIPSCRLLARLGFKKTSEDTGSFRKTPSGQPIEFLGYGFALTQDDWRALHAAG